MKSLVTLIKLYRKRLDDKRIELVREEETREELRKILMKIRGEMVSESTVAGKSHEVGYSFPGYIEQAMKTEKRIVEVIAELEKKIEILRDEIADEFSELKKYENLLEIRREAERKGEERREQIQLDEIAINSFLQEKPEE